MPMVSVILPTYNENGNIQPLLRALRSVMTSPTEYLVVDDDSPDGTAGAVRALMGEIPGIRLIVRPGQRGLTTAIQRGIDESRGRTVVWMDCDLSLPPSLVPRLVAEVEESGHDAAIGSRFVAGGADEVAGQRGLLVSIQKLGTRALNRLATLAMPAGVHDWTSGFIAIRADVARKYPLQGEHGEYFITLMADLVGGKHRLTEVPYRNVPRTVGRSKTADGVLPLLRRGTMCFVSVARAVVRLSRLRAPTAT